MKDPGSAITHLIAMVSAAIAAVPLLIKAAKTPGYLHLAALAVFILSMICLYGARYPVPYTEYFPCYQ